MCTYEHGSLELYLKNFEREPPSDKRSHLQITTAAGCKRNGLLTTKKNKAVAVDGIFTVVPEKNSGKISGEIENSITILT